MPLPPFVLPLVIGASAGTALGAVVARPVEPSLLSPGQTSELSRAVVTTGVILSIGLAAVILGSALRGGR